MGWLRLVGSTKLQVSFAKETYKADYILQKRPKIMSSRRIQSTTKHAKQRHNPHTATRCNTIQHTTTHCNTLQPSQHTTIHRNTPQHTATHGTCTISTGLDAHSQQLNTPNNNSPSTPTLHHTPTHRNTPQHTTTHCNTPQRPATHSTCTISTGLDAHSQRVNAPNNESPSTPTLRYTPTHRNTPQHTTSHRHTPQHTAHTHRNTQYLHNINGSRRVQPAATHCNTLQHAATHCNTPQHTVPAQYQRVSTRTAN